MPLKFRRVEGSFAICQLSADAAIPAWAYEGPFTSITRSGHELSIVCLHRNVPQEIKADAGWACLELQGPFPFSETGVLSSFIGPLSADAIPIFAVSTYNTDYVLIKEEFVEQAISVLRKAGHAFGE